MVLLLLLSRIFERVIGEHDAHVDLPEKRFEIRAEAVEDRDEVFFVGRHEHFLDKALDRFAVFVKQKSERRADEFLHLRVQALHRVSVEILLGFLDRLQQRVQMLAQNDRAFELELEIRKDLVRFGFRIDELREIDQSQLEAVVQQREGRFDLGVDRRRRAQFGEPGELVFRA